LQGTRIDDNQRHSRRIKPAFEAPWQEARWLAAARRIVTCIEVMQASGGRWLEAAGLVLVRRRPGSAKRVMFIALEDESGIANREHFPCLFLTSGSGVKT